MIWEMFDKKVFPQKMALHLGFYDLLKERTQKGPKKGAQTERERERACV